MTPKYCRLVTIMTIDNTGTKFHAAIHDGEGIHQQNVQHADDVIVILNRLAAQGWEVIDHVMHTIIESGGVVEHGSYLLKHQP